MIRSQDYVWFGDCFVSYVLKVFLQNVKTTLLQPGKYLTLDSIHILWQVWPPRTMTSFSLGDTPRVLVGTYEPLTTTSAADRPWDLICEKSSLLRSSVEQAACLEWALYLLEWALSHSFLSYSSSVMPFCVKSVRMDCTPMTQLSETFRCRSTRIKLQLEAKKKNPFLQLHIGNWLRTHQ